MTPIRIRLSRTGYGYASVGGRFTFRHVGDLWEGCDSYTKETWSRTTLRACKTRAGLILADERGRR